MNKNGYQSVGTSGSWVNKSFAALATGSANTAARYNFTQTYSIALDGSAAVEYDRW